LDGEKSYFKIFAKEEHFHNPTRYTQPMHVVFLHSAKITETGRLAIGGVSHFTFSITSIGKKKKTGAGPENFNYHLACPIRKDVRAWSKLIGKVILKIADLPVVSHRVRKASRHKVNKDWKQAHLVIKGGTKGTYSRRKPSLEMEPDMETPRMKVQPIAVPSVTLHATNRRVIGNNNFTKMPARPKTKTAAELIPNYIIKAIFKNDLDEILVWLATHRTFEEMEARSGEKLLHSACSCGNLNLAIFFLDKGAQPGAKDGYGETPLYLCVKNRSTKIAELLLEKGANVNEGADDGVTPLALACANGDVKMVNFLLDNGANPMTADIRGITPFFTACAQGHLEVVKILLQMNREIPGIVVVEKKTNNDLTPLYAAAQRGCLDVVKILVKMGAKWDEPNLQLITPFHAAVERGGLEMCEYLLSLDPPSDAFRTNSTDMSCLHTAAKFGRVELLDFLLELGLDLNATDMYGATPLDCARSFGHMEAAQFLEKRGGTKGEDFFRDPKSRARSMFAKSRMVGAGMADGRNFSRVGRIVPVVEKGEFGIDDEEGGEEEED
jgi:ankyrin repeat protein